VIKTKYGTTLPSNWKWYKALECMDVRDGTHDSPQYISEGYPLVTSKNLADGKIDFSTCSYISKEDHEAISKRSAVDNGDILYAMIGTIGNPVIVEKSHEFSIKNVALFKFNNKNVFNKYIYHFLNSEIAKRQFDSNSRGGTQKFISLTNIRNLKIPLPPLETQKQIAQVLETADQLRKDCQQVEQELNALAQSVFLEMFGDPMLNPKGWETTIFGDIIEVLTDYHANGSYETLQKHVELLDSKDYALMVRTTDLEKNNFTNNVNYINESAYSFLKKTKVYGGEIIVNKIGSAGKVYLMPNLNIPVSLGMNQFMLRLSSQANHVFMYYLLSSPFGKIIINKHVKGAVTKTIRKDAIRSLSFPLPPIHEQNKFSFFIQKLEQLQKQNKEKSQQLDDLFNGLLQKAFKGELNLKSTEYA